MFGKAGIFQSAAAVVAVHLPVCASLFELSCLSSLFDFVCVEMNLHCDVLCLLGQRAHWWQLAKLHGRTVVAWV